MIENIAAFFTLGGPIVVLLVFLSVIAVSIFFFKILQFSFWHIGQHRVLQHTALLVQQGKFTDAEAWLHSQRHLGKRTLLSAVQGIVRHGRDANKVELLREEVQREGQMALFKARRGLGFLELIVQIAPLLGLLGTVIGMIDAFQALAAAGSQVDPALLSKGIWVALLTTAVGLVVALIAQIGLSFLDTQVYGFQRQLEDSVTRIFTVLLRIPSVSVKSA